MKKYKCKIKCLSWISLLIWGFQLISAKPFIGAETYTIAIIKSNDIDAYHQAIAGFKEELKNQGITSKFKYYELKEATSKENDLLAQAKSSKPDLVLTVGTQAAKSAITYFKTIPLIFTMVLDSVQSGITPDYKASKANYTGLILSIPLETQFKKLTELVPKIEKIGILYTTATKDKIDRIKEINNLALASGFKIVAKPINSVSALPVALNKVLHKADALWAEVEPTIYNPATTQKIIMATLKYKKPFMAFSSHYVQAGALLALECDYLSIGKQAAKIADEILKGKNPGDMPIAYPETLNLIINKNTAEFLGIKFSATVQREAKKIFYEQT